MTHVSLNGGQNVQFHCQVTAATPSASVLGTAVSALSGACMCVHALFLPVLCTCADFQRVRPGHLLFPHVIRRTTVFNWYK